MAQPPSLTRTFGAFLLSAMLAAVAFFALTLVGWGMGPRSPVQELSDDRSPLLVMGVAGTLAGALLAWAVTNRRSIIVVAALVGLAPAILRVSAIFTDLY